MVACWLCSSQGVREGDARMMGRQRGRQKQLFYSFNLDDHVPADHLLRGIDQFLDLGDLRRLLTPFYSHTGRPSIDPQLLIRMLIVVYCFGMRSERRGFGASRTPNTEHVEPLLGV